MCSIHYLTNNSFTDWRFVDLLYLAHLDSPADYSYNNKFGIYVMWRKTSEQFAYLLTHRSRFQLVLLVIYKSVARERDFFVS